MSEFSNGFRQDFGQLLGWRRNVRHFLPDAVDGALLQRCLNSFALTPSVGLSQPWRLVRRLVRRQNAQARARAPGVGWVSILDPNRLRRDLDVPKIWALVANFASAGRKMLPICQNWSAWTGPRKCPKFRCWSVDNHV